MDTESLHSSNLALSRPLEMTRPPPHTPSRFHSCFMYVNKVRTITFSSCQPKSKSLSFPQSLSIFLCFWLSLSHCLPLSASSFHYLPSSLGRLSLRLPEWVHVQVLLGITIIFFPLFIHRTCHFALLLITFQGVRTFFMIMPFLT